MKNWWSSFFSRLNEIGGSISFKRDWSFVLVLVFCIYTVPYDERERTCEVRSRSRSTAWDDLMYQKKRERTSQVRNRFNSFVLPSHTMNEYEPLSFALQTDKHQTIPHTHTSMQKVTIHFISCRRCDLCSTNWCSWQFCRLACSLDCGLCRRCWAYNISVVCSKWNLLKEVISSHLYLCYTSNQLFII